jgi:hypothetical protein
VAGATGKVSKGYAALYFSRYSKTNTVYAGTYEDSSGNKYFGMLKVQKSSYTCKELYSSNFGST